MTNALGLTRRHLAGLLLASAALPAAAQTGADPLPSWRDGPRRRALLDFVAAVTREGGPDFVPPPARIATFDNDGTLWVEQPMYTQFSSCSTGSVPLAPQHPDWQHDPCLPRGDCRRPARRRGRRDGRAAKLIGTVQAGNTPESFQRIAAEWLAAARDLTLGSPYTGSSTSRCSRCLPCCAPGSRTSLSRPAGWSSSAPFPKRPMAFRRTVSSAPPWRWDGRTGRPHRADARGAGRLRR